MKMYFRLKSKSLSCSIFIICLIFLQSASAKKLEQNIWIKQPEMPFKEFRASVKTFGQAHISYAQYLLHQTRQKAKSFQLKDKLLIAQDLYLSGEENRAIKAFKQISRLAPLADWDEEDRRIILYSFLRQAQSEQEPEKRKALLLSASEFALFQINVLNYPDYNLFPPPLMEELKLIQEKDNFLFVNWNKIFPYHEIILINGKQIQKEEKINFPQAVYRVSAFSSSHALWSKSLSISELLTEKIKTKTLTSGHCENSKIKAEWEKTNIKLLTFSNCPKLAQLRLESHIKTKERKIRDHKKNILTANPFIKNKLSQPLNNFDSPPQLNSSLLKSEDFKTALKESELEKQTKISNIPAWLIIGAGAIAFTLLISLDQKKEIKRGDYIY